MMHGLINFKCITKTAFTYWYNLAGTDWLRPPWRWHNSVETCSSSIINCQLIMHLLVHRTKQWMMHGTIVKITPCGAQIFQLGVLDMLTYSYILRVALVHTKSNPETVNHQYSYWFLTIHSVHQISETEPVYRTANSSHFNTTDTSTTSKGPRSFLSNTPPPSYP